MNYALEEEPSYTAELNNIGDVRRIDEALDALTWGLSRDPASFPIIEGCEPLRYASTDRYTWDGGVIPSLEILFIVEGETVKLLAIRAIEDDPNEDW